MNHNLIEKLDGIHQFKNLKILEIKFNLIRDINEFTKISNPKELIILNAIGNPVEKDLRYTEKFLTKLFVK